MKTQNCLSYLVFSVTLIQREQIWQANNDKLLECVSSLPALSKRVWIHTFFVLPVWDRSMHSQRLRALAVSTAICFPCWHSDPAWHSFTRGRSGSLLFRCCRGTAEATVLGFANGSVSGVRDEHSLISTFSWQVKCLLSGLGSTRCGFFHPDWGTDTSTIWFWGIRCC